MTEARHELIPLSQPQRWRDALAAVPHAHAHTWGFCRAMQLTSGLATYLYRYDRGATRVVCPLSERPFRGHTDVVTPYGFGGFAATGAGESFAEDWADFARLRGWVCGYFALNPLLSDAEGFGVEETHSQSGLYVIDLRGSIEEILGRVAKSRRQQLRGRPSEAARLNDDREQLTDFLLATYADFFARRGAGPATRFAAATMAAIAELDDVFLVGAESGARIEAVAVFGHAPTGGDYLFNVSVPGGERHSAALVWFAVERLHALGATTLNLGGGVREGDGVARFKRRFGAAYLPLVSLRQIYVPTVYQRLCRQAGVCAGDRSGYFPAYRAADG